MSPRKEMVGKVFGRLTVLSLVPNTSPILMWNCLCSCGTSIIASGVNLRSGNTQSCTCRQKDLAREYNKKPAGVATVNSLLRRYTGNAARKGRVWDLTEYQFLYLLCGNCEYCGIAPYRVCKPDNWKKSTDAMHLEKSAILYNGIDRSDNTKGYEWDNCVSCCSICNIAKRNMTIEEFLAWVERVHEHQKCEKALLNA